MRKGSAVALLILMFAITAAAGSKIEGTTTLKDFQPFGTIEKKTHKNQQYDLSFAAMGKQYTCRSVEKESLKATDFVVGTDVQYQINGDKGKLKKRQRQAGGMHHRSGRRIAGHRLACPSTINLAPDLESRHRASRMASVTRAASTAALTSCVRKMCAPLRIRAVCAARFP